MRVEFRRAAVRLYSGATFSFTGVLDLEPGAIVLLIGDNGAGKSLLLTLLSGLFESEEVGGIESVDRDAVHVTRLPANGTEVSWLRQEPASNFMSRCSADEIVLPFMNKRIEQRASARRLNDILSEVGVDGPAILRQSIRSLSSGQRQRLAFCVALAPVPDVLLLDEPFARLDEASQKHLAILIGKNRARTCTIVATHHPLEFAQRTSVSSHVIVERSGADITLNQIDGSPRGASLTLASLISAAHLSPLASHLDFGWVQSRVAADVTDSAQPRFISGPGTAEIASPGLQVQVDTKCISQVGPFELPSGLSLLVGQNGSGKTSLCEVLAGMTAVNPLLPWPKRASGSLSGRSTRTDDIVGLRRSGRSVLLPAEPRTWLFQESVEQELLGTFPDTHQHRTSFAASAGLPLDAVPNDLSYGQQRLISLLTIPSSGMEVVVLDEFFSDLSPASSARVAQYLADRILAGDWNVVVVSTANLATLLNCLLAEELPPAVR